VAAFRSFGFLATEGTEITEKERKRRQEGRQSPLLSGSFRPTFLLLCGLCDLCGYLSFLAFERVIDENSPDLSEFRLTPKHEEYKIVEELNSEP
jgi:hypothetical protein